jgi:hypothetical protein
MRRSIVGDRREALSEPAPQSAILIAAGTICPFGLGRRSGLALGSPEPFEDLAEVRGAIGRREAARLLLAWIGEDADALVRLMSREGMAVDLILGEPFGARSTIGTE